MIIFITNPIVCIACANDDDITNGANSVIQAAAHTDMAP